MKKSGKCPKCGSKEIEHFDKIKTGGGFGGGEALGVGGGLIAGSNKHLEAFICKNCGFTELYLPKKFLK
jgi:predicted nucleic-acid-binding Zn-ribbon protein